MIRSKKYMALLLAAAVGASAGLGAMSGCAKKKSANEITIVSMYNGPIFTYAAQEYMKTHEGKSVVAQAKPYDGYNQWLRVQMIGGEAPDVIFIEDVDDLAALGVFTDLNPYMEENSSYLPDAGKWSASFKESFLDRARDNNGKLWMVPFTQYGIGMFANKDQYAAAGVEETPKNWTEFLGVNAKLKAEGYTPWNVSTQYADAQTRWPLEMMYDAFFRAEIPAINQLHKDGWTFDANNPASVYGEKLSYEELYLAFKKGTIDPAKSPKIKKIFQTMIEAVPSFNSDYLSKPAGDCYSDFASAKSTHFFNGTWYLPSLNSYFNDFVKDGHPEKVFDYEIFPFPKVTSEEVGTDILAAGEVNDIVKIRNGFAIPASTTAARRELAVDFIKFMTSPEMMQKMMDKINPDTNSPYCGDIPLITGVTSIEEAAALTPDVEYADLRGPFAYYDEQDREAFVIDYQELLSGKMKLDTFLSRRSASNLTALDRNLRQYQSELNIAWLDAELAKLK